ncbi:hypothetical protein PTNB73_08280 [Pyrenophora teres f. teres]|nr:hypothetical protein PTNB73_08280 [Pyrenophora teres f. teres]
MAAVADEAQPFRFMDLPGELRNKVYELLLCSYEAVQDQTEEKHPTYWHTVRDYTYVSHSNDTAILRVNSQVHREAYHVMVKTNRFVSIVSAGRAPVNAMVRGACIPVVARGKRVTNFRGRVLHVVISKTYGKHAFVEERPHGPEFVPVMILARDLPLFCRGFSKLQDNFFRFLRGPEVIKIVFIMAPVLLSQHSWCQDDLTGFFSEATQNAILGPFLQLWGVYCVDVCGRVLHKVAVSLKDGIEAARWQDPEDMIKALTEATKLGTEHKHKNDLMKALNVWNEAYYAIARMRVGRSWIKLVDLGGGKTFIDKVAKLRLILHLNVTESGFALRAITQKQQ